MPCQVVDTNRACCLILRCYREGCVPIASQSTSSRADWRCNSSSISRLREIASQVSTEGLEMWTLDLAITLGGRFCSGTKGRLNPVKLPSCKIIVRKMGAGQPVSSFHFEVEKSKHRDELGNRVPTVKCHGRLMSETAGGVKEAVNPLIRMGCLARHVSILTGLHLTFSAARDFHENVRVSTTFHLQLFERN
jgi:hypothetical protein